MRKNKALLLAIISGFLVAFSFIPFSPIIGLVALVPLWISLDQATSYKQAFLYSWITQFLLSLIGFHWIATTAHDFGYMPWSLSILVLLAFCCLVHLHFCVAALAHRYLQSKWNLNSVSSDLLKVICFFLAETYWPMIFPWNFGYTWLTSNFPLFQTAEIWGFTGISFLTILANLIFKQIVDLRSAGNIKQARNFVAIFLASFFAINLLGYGLKLSLPPFDQKLRVGVVQANIGNFDKIQAEHGAGFQEKIIEKYLALSRELISKQKEKVDFIVWPETAIPIAMAEWNKDNYLYKKVSYGMAQLKTPLISGSFLADSHTYNAAISMDAKGKIQDEYKKSLLLAFGETVPFTENHPDIQKQLKKLVPALSFFGKGPGAKPIDFLGQKMGVNICYEAIHPNFMTGYKNQGANVLINLTNDSWFGQTFEPYQHLYMTLARAIELRLPLIRSTNTGITTAIEASGEIKELSPIGKEWTGVFEINAHSKPPTSLYQKFAAYIPVILAALSALSILQLRRHNANNKAS